MRMKTLRRRLSFSGSSKKSKGDEGGAGESRSRKSSDVDPPRRKLSAPAHSFIPKFFLGGSLMDIGKKSEEKLSKSRKPKAETKPSIPGLDQVRVRDKQRRHSENDIHKRYSMFPEIQISQLSINGDEGHISRRERRFSLHAVGFGKLESYKKLELLGQGTYATVYKGKSRLTEGVVALKEIRLEHDEGAPCTAIREISLLRDLRHANIVTLHDIIYTPSCLTLVFEYLEKDLKQYMEERRNRLDLTRVKLFLFQLFRGLAFCHSRRILHRDLKPQNLLINEKNELKLADFGLARAKSIPTHTYSNEVVTLWYRPPDVLLGDTAYSGHIDIWGAGCIFYEMVTGKPAFPGNSEDAQLILIFRKLGTPSESSWPGITHNSTYRSLRLPTLSGEPLPSIVPRLSSSDPLGIDLLARTLHPWGKKRISAAQAMDHPYFANLLPQAMVRNLAYVDSVVDAMEENYEATVGHKSEPTGHRSGVPMLGTRVRPGGGRSSSASSHGRVNSGTSFDRSNPSPSELLIDNIGKRCGDGSSSSTSSSTAAVSMATNSSERRRKESGEVDPWVSDERGYNIPVPSASIRCNEVSAVETLVTALKGDSPAVMLTDWTEDEEEGQPIMITVGSDNDDDDDVEDEVVNKDIDPYRVLNSLC